MDVAVTGCNLHKGGRVVGLENGDGAVVLVHGANLHVNCTPGSIRRRTCTRRKNFSIMVCCKLMLSTTLPTKPRAPTCPRGSSIWLRWPSSPPSAVLQDEAPLATCLSTCPHETGRTRGGVVWFIPAAHRARVAGGARALYVPALLLKIASQYHPAGQTSPRGLVVDCGTSRPCSGSTCGTSRPCSGSTKGLNS
jgi:hypothetical protein